MIENVGIDKLSFYTTGCYIDVDVFAKQKDVSVEKITVGLGQKKISVITPHEDVVTMGCEAAYDILSTEDIDKVDLVLFATESGVDFSKSAGVFVHELLNLKKSCRVLEIKQACYAATGALQLACSYIKCNTAKKCLVIASDIAWYGFDTPGEVTQGCGAIAMLISSSPRICTVNQGSFYTSNINDFFRPSYSQTPIVDGKLSVRSYLEILNITNTNFRSDLEYFCFHLPFSTMANKANAQLPNPISDNYVANSTEYTSQVGNIYNGSLYLGLLSLLINEKKDLSLEDIGMFSYGSGAVAEFFTITLTDAYHKNIDAVRVVQMMNTRQALTYQEYTFLWKEFEKRESSANYGISSNNFLTKRNRFSLVAIENGRRVYRKL